MDKKDALALAVATLQILPTLVTLTKSATELVNNAIKIIKAAQAENRDPTAEEWESFNVIIENLRDQRDAAIGDNNED